MKEIFMKKSAIFLLALCIASVICCGCSQAGEDADDEKNTPVVVVGSDEYEPFNYVDENGDFAGIEYALETVTSKRESHMDKICSPKQILRRPEPENSSEFSGECLRFHVRLPL